MKDPEKVKTGRKSKRKGAAGEREAAACIQKYFPGSSCHRGRQYHGGPGTPDVVTNIEGLHLEIKRTESLSIYTAMEQAKKDAKDAVPVVLHRRSHKEWLAVVELPRLPELIQVLQPYLKGENNDGLCDSDGESDAASGLA